MSDIKQEVAGTAVHARLQFIFQATVRPFVSEVQTLHRKVYFVGKPIFCGIKSLLICFWKKTNNFSTKKWHPAWHLSKNKTLQIVLTNGIGVVPYVTLFPLVLQGNRSLEWKYFLVTVKKNDPGVWAVYGASRHVKGWRKMTAVSHQDLTAFTKQLTPFWQMEIYPKEGTNLFFSLFMFSTAKLFTNSFDLWFHLHLRWEGQPVGTNVMDFGEQHFEFWKGRRWFGQPLVLQKAEAHLIQRRKIRH